MNSKNAVGTQCKPMPPYQDWDLLWGNRTWPVFTECFQNTFLIWLASGWLWLTVPVYLTYLISLPYQPLPGSWKGRAKESLTVLQLLLCAVKLPEPVYAARLRIQLEACTLGLVLLYQRLEKQKGFVTSGVLWIYWFLVSATYSLAGFAKLLKQEAATDQTECTIFCAYCLLSVCQFVISCLADTASEPPGRAQCPYDRSSFLSRVTFSWLDGFIRLGYSRPITDSDLYELNPRTQSKTVVPVFEDNWENERKKLPTTDKQARFDDINSKDNGINSKPVNEAKMGKNKLNTETETDKTNTAEDKVDAEKDSKPGVSLVKVLLKTFGWDYLVGLIWICFNNVLHFFNPLLLKLLIEFSEDPDSSSWKGYTLATGLLVVKFVQVFSNRQLHSIYYLNITLRVRSALTAAIYKKALSMNNAARVESTVGEIVNLMSVDAEHIRHVYSMLWAFVACPLSIILSLIFLYNEVGYAVLAGLGVLLIVTPVNAILVRWCRQASKLGMEEKDKRMKLMNEILNGIKVLKLYAWEMAFGKKILDIREKEAGYTRKDRTAGMLMHFSWTLAPFAVRKIGVATFSTYIFMSENHRLDAQTAFVALSLFDVLRGNLNYLPWLITDFIKAVVSVKRLNKFLNRDDIDPGNVTSDPSDDAITINNGTFRWDEKIGPFMKDINVSIPKGGLVAIVGQVGCGKTSLVSAMLGEMEKLSGQVNVDGSTAYVPQQAWIQNATLRNNILFGKAMIKARYNNVIQACSLNPDIDLLASGDKTMIGEKGVNLSGGQKQRVSLARAVYYDADIYLLDDPLSAVDSHVGKHIFQQVIGKKGLLKEKTRVLVTHGIKWLPYVDKIITMSDGSIAEVGSYEELMEHDGAFAKFMKTYLTENCSDDSDTDEEVENFKSKTIERLNSFNMEDDVLIEANKSGHSHISRIDHSCLRRRTVSHSENCCTRPNNVKRAVSVTDSKSVKTEENPKVFKRLSSAVIRKSEDNRSDHQIFKRSVSTVDTNDDDDDVYDDDKAGYTEEEEEEIETGSVGMSVLTTYLQAVGYKFVFLIMFLYWLDLVGSTAASFWLTQWTSDTDLQNLTLLPADSEERYSNNIYYLSVYGWLGLLQAVMILLCSRTQLLCSLRAGAKIHKDLLLNVLRGPMSFFETPTGRIVARFSKDVNSVDFGLPDRLGNMFNCIQNAIITVGVIIYSTPGFSLVMVPLGILYTTLQRFFTPSHRQLGRLESKSRAPIFSHYSETLNGVAVIRAFKLQKRFEEESNRRVDKYQECQFLVATVNNWLGSRMNLTGGVITWLVALFAVMGRHTLTGALVGLSVSYAMQITRLFEWMMHMISNLENDMISLERVNQYTTNPVEAPLKTSKEPQPYWPESGKVEFSSYSVRYKEGVDCVLKGINVSIKPGEKVGIVGRTGAGKSTLTLSVFRLLEPASGTINIDDEDVTIFGLHDLRSRLTILPQEPVLFAGSLRMNIDPLNNHTDEQLWTALEHAHLQAFVEKLPEKLDYECGEGGQNLSMGQRQLICLARSLLRKSKVLVLDEATAAVDMATDELIQKTINTEFKECTVMTIAHRLNTVVDYDKILVLDKGKVKEFDSPKNLLNNKTSVFYGMAKDAGLV